MKTLLEPQQAMERAIEVSEQARLRSAPNPWVGCVLVRDGVVVGEGATQPPGGDHAEVQALKMACQLAKGATAYCTLEPCAHHGRTPPCTQALINAGVARVVAAVVDPDPCVSGRGLQQLQQAGIATEVGLCAEQVQASLQPYLHHRRTGLPFCIAKAAVSLDGRMAAADGSSQWITGDAARADAHQLRAHSQAILVGAGTATRDNPSLTVRHYQAAGMRQPLRVLLDATGRVPLDSAIFDTSVASTLVITGDRACLDRWKYSGVEVAVVPEDSSGLDLRACMQLLGARGVLQLLVEGGPTLLGSLWRAELIHQLSLYIGPRLLGDSGMPLFAGVDIPTIEMAPTLQLIGSRQLGSSFRLDYSTQSSKLLR